MPNLIVGYRFYTTYVDAPLEPSQQYAIGAIVDIADSESGRVLALGRVVDTDPRQATLEIEEVFSNHEASQDSET